MDKQFVKDGVMQIPENVKHHTEVTKALRTLYAIKNEDYGDSFKKSFEEYGLTMACIRIEDKLNRLKTLNKNKEQKVQDESIIDTLMDLANYSIMTIMELEDKASGKV